MKKYCSFLTTIVSVIILSYSVSAYGFVPVGNRSPKPIYKGHEWLWDKIDEKPKGSPGIDSQEKTSFRNASLDDSGRMSFVMPTHPRAGGELSFVMP
ncbi:MAG: hypothetical protein JOY96_09890, partial [Verrucomicrobia bacterium]|nr:hypothetical protein [Verrucomicrobiota bacterium]